jgi:hypothetical protein
VDSKDLFDYKYDLLKEEISTLQSSISEYDKILFTIKGWAITVFSGFIFLIASEEDHRVFFIAMAALAIALFWSLGLIYKTYQQRFLSRYNFIEKYLHRDLQDAIRTRNLAIPVPDINGRVSVGIVSLPKATLKAARLWHMSLIYAVMLVMLVILLVAEVF